MFRRPLDGLSGFKLQSLPTQNSAAPRQPGAETGDEDLVAALNPAGRDRFIESDRNRTRRSVAVTVEVVVDPVAREAEHVRHRVDDPDVRLVRHEEGDVVD